ncbi:MAG: chalcone isomerase family protein [Bdellovibrionales bacterium]|nr:chalcone isomerase family protein [Massilia sp.]
MFKRLMMLITMLLCAASALAAPAHLETHVPQARLAGHGPFTYFGINVYDAELWVGEKGYQPGQPFALELRYARKLDGIKIAQASADEMEKLGMGSTAQRTAWLARMKEIFPDVTQGSRIAGVFLPAGGVRFYLDGKPLATVPDQEFANAFFAIWLDPNTSAKKLRLALLRDAGPR